MITNIKEAVKVLKAFRAEFKCEAELVLGDKGYAIVVCIKGLPSEYMGLRVLGA